MSSNSSHGLKCDELINQAIQDHKIGLLTPQQLRTIVYKLDRKSFIEGKTS